MKNMEKYLVVFLKKCKNPKNWVHRVAIVLPNATRVIFVENTNSATLADGHDLHLI
jgi:hypothetical protein